MFFCSCHLNPSWVALHLVYSPPSPPASEISFQSQGKEKYMLDIFGWRIRDLSSSFAKHRWYIPPAPGQSESIHILIDFRCLKLMLSLILFRISSTVIYSSLAQTHLPASSLSPSLFLTVPLPL
jgi:hypothetical protein